MRIYFYHILERLLKQPFPHKVLVRNCGGGMYVYFVVHCPPLKSCFFLIQLDTRLLRYPSHCFDPAKSIKKMTIYDRMATNFQDMELSKNCKPIGFLNRECKD